jgi:holo-[acyl-carrier protein] synthase
LIYGTGVDVCSIERLEQSLSRTENLGARLFHENERDLPPQSLAARFAAKEALAKALGTPAILVWNEIEVVKDALGKPSLKFHGKTSEKIRDLGDLRFHLSMSHDGPVAVATVVVESI